MASGHSPPESAHSPNPAPNPPRIPLVLWLAVGGTGAPPTIASFSLMASERKAAYRAEKAYEEARKAASAEFEARWPAIHKQQKSHNRRELMRVYGPKKISAETDG